MKTIIYEENGQKFVKKQTMCPEALPHLKKMKDSYTKLTASIINPNIKLAKIINESEDSLTFEFIEGISLDTKYNNAKKLNTDASDKIIDEYRELLKTGFKTTIFNSADMVTNVYQELFGKHDYTELDGTLCFEGISNIDLIFSNIIFKDDNIYLIDYEWVFDCNVPLEYIVFRTLHKDNDLHWKMEKHLIDKVVVNKNGFLKIQNNYL
ncbi:MAG: hypothetical protein KAH72_06560, partial [Flavobacteriaceae bacterium]|nr:hypothetical protein [Flavobacteriaceae bacterium]